MAIMLCKSCNLVIPHWIIWVFLLHCIQQSLSLKIFHWLTRVLFSECMQAASGFPGLGMMDPSIQLLLLQQQVSYIAYSNSFAKPQVNLMGSIWFHLILFHLIVRWIEIVLNLMNANVSLIVFYWYGNVLGCDGEGVWYGWAYGETSGIVARHG